MWELLLPPHPQGLSLCQSSPTSPHHGPDQAQKVCFVYGLSSQIHVIKVISLQQRLNLLLPVADTLKSFIVLFAKKKNKTWHPCCGPACCLSLDGQRCRHLLARWAPQHNGAKTEVRPKGHASTCWRSCLDYPFII